MIDVAVDGQRRGNGRRLATGAHRWMGALAAPGAGDDALYMRSCSRPIPAGLCEGSPSKGPRRGFIHPELEVGDPIPAVLEPRGKATIAAPLEVWDSVKVTARTRVYATTACDHESAQHDPFLSACFDVVTEWLRGVRKRAGG